MQLSTISTGTEMTSNEIDILGGKESCCQTIRHDSFKMWQHCVEIPKLLVRTKPL